MHIQTSKGENPPTVVAAMAYIVHIGELVVVNGGEVMDVGHVVGVRNGMVVVETLLGEMAMVAPADIIDGGEEEEGYEMEEEVEGGDEDVAAGVLNCDGSWECEDSNDGGEYDDDDAGDQDGWEMMMTSGQVSASIPLARNSYAQFYLESRDVDATLALLPASRDRGLAELLRGIPESEAVKSNPTHLLQYLVSLYLLLEYMTRTSGQIRNSEIWAKIVAKHRPLLATNGLVALIP